MELGKEFWIGFGAGVPTGIAADESVRAIASYLARRKAKRVMEDKTMVTNLARHVMGELSVDLSKSMGGLKESVAETITPLLPLFSALLAGTTADGLKAALYDDESRKALVELISRAVQEGITESLKKEALEIRVDHGDGSGSTGAQPG